MPHLLYSCRNLRGQSFAFMSLLFPCNSFYASSSVFAVGPSSRIVFGPRHRKKQKPSTKHATQSVHSSVSEAVAMVNIVKKRDTHCKVVSDTRGMRNKKAESDVRLLKNKKRRDYTDDHSAAFFSLPCNEAFLLNSVCSFRCFGLC